MIQNKIIGITGGISTGKSTVCEIIKSKGYTVIDADKISREVLSVGTDGYREVVDFFGESVLNSDKSIDRKKLGEKIFKDTVLREKLNSITHPRILQNILKEINNYKEDKPLFLDIPLLLELKDDLVKSGIYISEIWLVYVDRETQISRLMKRDKINRSEALLKISAQMDIEDKKEYADKIIDNTDTKIVLIKNIEKALREIS